jgi:TfoX/Sxy family transcriptional regulator of competence genes
MKIPKPTPAARALFERLVPEDDRVEVKPMFGNLGAFVNGNMFMGVFGPDIGLKLSDADLQALRQAGGQAFGPADRPMSGYVSLPAAFSEATAKSWVARSLNHVAGFLPKTKKGSSPRAKLTS